MGNKNMITQRYNYKAITSPISAKPTKSKYQKLLEDTCPISNRNIIVENDDDKIPTWYVSSHNKPKVTDRNSINYTNVTNSRCRRIRTSNKDYDIYIEPSKLTWNEEWHDSNLPSKDLLDEQIKLYNKLKRQYERSKQRVSNNSLIEVAETTVVNTYNMFNLGDCLERNRMRNIIKMSMG